MSFGEQRACLLEQLRCAIDAGVDVVQVRERDLEAGALFGLVDAMVAATRGTRTRIVVNDRLDVALAAGADGVHLRGDSVPPAAVRRVAPKGFLVGCSVHAAEDAAFLRGEADYLIAGTVWSTPSKPLNHPLIGADGLAAIAARARVPVLAIGGVSVDRFDEVAAAGAAGVAAIGLFIHPRASADTTIGCGAVPLHDLARRARG